VPKRKMENMARTRGDGVTRIGGDEGGRCGRDEGRDRCIEWGLDVGESGENGNQGIWREVEEMEWCWLEGGKGKMRERWGMEGMEEMGARRGELEGGAMEGRWRGDVDCFTIDET